MRRRLVLVEWIDSYSLNNWRPLDTIDASVLHCRSVGWVAAESKESITLVASVSGEKNGDVRLCGCGDISIPRCAIRKITRLKQ